ncbi:L,D-transpeptidase family protein [Enterococcus ratti]|uniref:L,D-transpeptidase family protein n=1 Tax=Enterococcus ratti TaxID=150033 RepID=UPI00090002BF|nr:L,D-transpeptidase family protein [Enterococcus ratti]
MTRSSHRKKSKLLQIWLLSVLGVILVLITFYVYRSTYYTKHFLPNTQINSINVSNLTLQQANDKLKDTYSNQKISIEENGKVWEEIAKSDLGYKEDFSTDLLHLLNKQNIWAWGMTYVFAAENKEIDPQDTTHQKLDSTIERFTNKLTETNKTRTPTQDATIEKNGESFKIKAEVKGNVIDVETAIQALKNSVKDGKNKIDLATFQLKPKITSTDKNLKEQLHAMNSIAKVKGIYNINGNTFQIPASDVSNWLTYVDGKVGVDTTQVKQYVTALGEKYNTSTNATKFKSTKRGEVTVPAGTFSWTINTDAETKALEKAILSGNDFTRSPLVEGATTADHPLIEDTYIEVDLKNQHMWYYKDGKIILETDIVSGKPASPTPTGVFYIWNKEENATLKGTNDDGTPYASPVNYWMPVDWTGVGIHDSDWQPQYGGDLWKTRGSHGCVNTPPNVMKELFEKVEKGTPVLIF